MKAKTLVVIASVLLSVSAVRAEVPVDYGVTVGGRAVRVETARCSAAPINTRWPGHQRPTYQTELCAFVRFDLTEPAKVEVTAPRDFKTVVVRPFSKGVKPVVEGRRISFTVAKPGGYSLELDGLHHNLHLFADPPADYKVDRNDPKTRWFGPGEHEVGVIAMKSGETVYLDEGAVVYGRVMARDADDIRILGRGILDASHVKEVYIRNDPAKDREEFERGFAVANVKRYDTIRLEFCDRVKIDGITIRDSQIYNIRPIGCRDLEIGWTKTLGNWRYNSDGFDMHNCERVRIHDCFIRTYDDAVCVKGWDCWMDESEMLHDGYRHDVFRDVTVERCVLWNDWGKSCEIGAETRAREICGVTYRDIDVLHPVAYACDIMNVDYADVHDVLFEDIRVELDDVWRPCVMQKREGETWRDPSGGKAVGSLLGLSVLKHPEYSAGGVRRGRIRDVTFRNIRATGKKLPLSYFYGCDEKANVSGVTIDGLHFNGRRLGNAAEANLKWGKFVAEPVFRGDEGSPRQAALP